MKRIKTVFVLSLMLLMLVSAPLRLSAGIPVFDYLRYLWDEIAQKARMKQLGKILNKVDRILRLERETREFFKRVYAALRGSDLISARQLLWQILNSTYLRDKYKNDPWWVVWHTDVKMAEMFPQLQDFSHITGSFIYQNSVRFRQYADGVIDQMKEQAREVDNLKEHLKLMRNAYEKNIEQINLFSNRLQEYAKGNHVGRLIGLIANLELMNARLNLTLNLNRRVMMTLLLKQETWGQVHVHRQITQGFWNNEE